MSTTFSRSLRALAADHFRRPAAGLLFGGVLLAAWTGWMFLSRITVYETSPLARLEVEAAAFSIEAPIGGRVIKSGLVLGREVKPGDELLVLDASAEKLQLGEEQARLDSLSPQLTALRAELAAEEDSLKRAEEQARVTRAVDSSRFHEAQAAAHLADDEAERMRRLQAAGHVAELELARARAQSQERRAAADTTRLETDRRDLEARTQAGQRRANLERLRREEARLSGDQATSRATIARLSYEIERHRLLAPVAGHLAAVTPLQEGMVVKVGDRLGSVVPSGALKIVADFPPASAVGRIRPGQEGRLRLDGFPWSQYGTIEATVTAVGSEARYGRVRVELAAHPDEDSPIPLQHGLPGVVEIEVERVSPARLLLRAAGQLVAGRPSS